MKSGEILVLFLLLPIVTEAGIFDFFSGIFDNDDVRPFDSKGEQNQKSLICDTFKSVIEKFGLYVYIVRV